MMSDILLKDAVNCLSSIPRSNINLHPHYIVRSKQRNISDQWIYNCLTSEEIVGILKQSDDKFRLYYKHPESSNKYDLIIVVVINNLNKKNITVITTYKQNISKRVRNHGQKVV